MLYTQRKKDNVDERQELKLLKIEYYACWFAFLGLVIAVLVQCIFENANFKKHCRRIHYFNESSSLYYNKLSKRRHVLKTNLLASMTASLVAGMLWFIISYRNYPKLTGSIAVFIFMFILTNAICLLLLTLLSQFYKKEFKN